MPGIGVDLLIRDGLFVLTISGSAVPSRIPKPVICILKLLLLLP